MPALSVQLTFTEDLLGTASANPEIHEEFVATKSADKDKIKQELQALPSEDLVEKSMTVFPRDEEGSPIVWDYQVKGFFKDACSMLRRVPDTRSKKLTAYKKVIDGLVFPQPRMIKIHLDAEMGDCQRPLRGQTAQGERIALAHSEAVPAGSKIQFNVMYMDKKLEKTIREWLDYGELRGLGQWRNSGKGRFTWEEL